MQDPRPGLVALDAEAPREERHRRRARHDAAGPRGGEEGIEHQPLHPLGRRVDLNLGAELADLHLAHVDRGGHREGLAIAAARRRVLHRHRGVGRAARRVLDGVHPEDRAHRGGAQLVDAGPERLELVQDHVEGGALVAPVEHRAQQRDPPGVPADRGGRRRGGRGGGARLRGPGGARAPVGGAPAAGGRGVRAQAELLDAGAHRVAGDAEHCRGPRDVPSGLGQSRAQVFADRVVQRAGGREGGGRRPRLFERARGQLQHLRADVRPVGQERDPLQHVAQLAHVPRPVVGQQPLLGLGGQGLGGQPVVRADARQEVLGEEDHVAPPLPQRGQAQGHDPEPVVEVLAEAALADSGLEVLVRGADDPRVGRLGVGAAQPAHGARLDHGQQLGLQRLRQQADLVEEDGALVRGLEEAGFRASRVGEGAPLVAEQLRLEQRLRDRRAVQRDERARRARAGPVEHARHEPLAASGFPFEQDRGRSAPGERAREQTTDGVPDRLDRRALAEELAERVHHREER